MLSESKKNELIPLIEDALLRTSCSRDEHGNIVYDIYADYNDEFSEEQIRKICESEDPRSTAEDIIFEAYDSAYFDYYRPDIIKNVLEDPDVHENIADCTIQEVDDVCDLICDCFYVNYPIEHYFRNTDVLVDILVDAGDLNYDYSMNSIAGFYAKGVQEDSGLLWLTRQQGYTKTQLKETVKARGKVDSKFLRSVWEESDNTTTSMNALTFLVRMSLDSYLELADAIKAEEHLNRSYHPSERRGRGYIVLDKSTECMLYDPWNGAGGVLGIELERDVRLPIRYIDTAQQDGCRGYSVRTIYGVTSALWDDTVKEIHPMKNNSKKVEKGVDK